MEVVVVVDWEEVSVVVGVAQLQVRPRDAVDGLEESAELQEASRAVSLQSKAPIFCLKLVRATAEQPVSQLVQAARPPAWCLFGLHAWTEPAPAWRRETEETQIPSESASKKD